MTIFPADADARKLRGSSSVFIKSKRQTKQQPLCIFPSLFFPVSLGWDITNKREGWITMHSYTWLLTCVTDIWEHTNVFGDLLGRSSLSGFGSIQYHLGICKVDKLETQGHPWFIFIWARKPENPSMFMTQIISEVSWRPQRVSGSVIVMRKIMPFTSCKT